MNLTITDKPTLSRTDDIFQIKEFILKACKRWAKLSRYQKMWLKMETTSINFTLINHYIKKNGWKLIQAKQNDADIIKVLIAHSGFKMSKQFYRFQFDRYVLAELNDLIEHKYNLMPPLYAIDDEIKTAFNGFFYAKIEEDWLEHKTLVISEKGQEKFFTLTANKTSFDEIPLVRQPFWILKNSKIMSADWTQKQKQDKTIDDYFRNTGNSTFESVWRGLKGRLFLQFGTDIEI